MNDNIVVNFKTPENEILEDSELPVYFSVEQAIDELIDELNLPRLNESSQRITYILRSKKLRRTLTNNETVYSAQIPNGDTLEIIPFDNTLPSYSQDNGFSQSSEDSFNNNSNFHSGNNVGSPELPPTVPGPNTSEINVMLSVLDLNRHETVSLPINRPVGELVRLIVRNYNLPELEGFGGAQQPIIYNLQSKAMGRFLDKQKTLMQEQIPPLDRLTLHKKETPG